MSSAAASRTDHRLQPMRALAAVGRLMRDKEDTEAVFEIMRALSGRSIPNGYARLIETARGGAIAMRAPELAPLLDDHETLSRLPAGSVAAAYLDFVREREISAEGLAIESRKAGDADIEALHPHAWYARRLRDVHDLWHVLTGYRTDALGEVCVVAFSHAQTGSSGFGLIALAGARDLARLLPGRPVWAAVRQAWANGRSAAWLPAEDWEAVLAEPLEAARARLKIARPSHYLAVPAIERDGVPADLTEGRRGARRTALRGA